MTASILDDHTIHPFQFGRPNGPGFTTERSIVFPGTFDSRPELAVILQNALDSGIPLSVRIG